MELMIELFVSGCGLFVWCFLMLGWFIYISKRKPSKSVCVVGTCLLIAPVIVVLGGFANGLRLDTQESDFFNAANHGDNAQVEQLIRSGADINHEVDNFDMTPPLKYAKQMVLTWQRMLCMDGSFVESVVQEPVETFGIWWNETVYPEKRFLFWKEADTFVEFRFELQLGEQMVADTAPVS